MVEYQDVFAKQGFDVGWDTELKIKLTPGHSLPVYAQCPPAPSHLQDEKLVELALLKNFTIVKTLSRSKFSGAMLAHR